MSDIPELVRPAFFDGQRLDADDLTAIFEYQRELRWLHNRALHGWGVATGLSVTGAKGDGTVTVSPGYALDCEGHDLVLAESETLEVPPVAGPVTYYLTISYIEDADLPSSDDRTGACLGTGAVRRAEAPSLRWQSPTDLSDAETRYRYGYDIVLATAEVEDCALAAALSTSLRRELLACSPFVASGATRSGRTRWSYYSANGVALGVQTLVDTSAAGFQSTPSYYAQLQGPRTLAGASASDPSVLLDGFSEIASPSATGFVLRVLMPRDLEVSSYALNPTKLFDEQLPQVLSERLNWHVHWIGVES